MDVFFFAGAGWVSTLAEGQLSGWVLGFGGVGNDSAISHQSARMRGQPEIDDWKLADARHVRRQGRKREGYLEVLYRVVVHFIRVRN